MNGAWLSLDDTPNRSAISWVDRPVNTKVASILPGISRGGHPAPVLEVTSWTFATQRLLNQSQTDSIR